MQESNFYKFANRHFEEIKKHVDLWLDSVEEIFHFEKQAEKKHEEHFFLHNIEKCLVPLEGP